MARPLSKEVREAIVSTYENGIGTIPEVAKIFKITPRAVSNYLRIHRETGDLTPRTSPGRPAILNDENLEIIKTIILLNNDGTLQEYCDEFKKETGIEVTIVTIYNACNKLKIRRKKRVIMRKKEIA